MNLTIEKKGNRQFPYYLILNNGIEFCRSYNLENATLIANMLENENPPIPKKIKLSDLLQKIKEITYIDLDADFSRNKDVCDVRKIYAHIAYENGYNLKEIGKLIKRDHSSVIYILKKFDDFYQTDPNFRKLYNEIKSKV